MNLQNNKGKFNKEQFCQLEDEQVIEKVHVGDSDALDYLITKYQKLCSGKSKILFLNRGGQRGYCSGRHDRPL